MSISSYFPICDALARLFHPLVEVVIHDVATNRIHYKIGNLSPRKVGDLSLLDADDLKGDLSAIVYPKRGFDGRLIKSVSVLLEKKWLLCVNCDISIFSELKKLSEQFLAVDVTEGPKSLFHNDWQEKLHHVVHNFLQERRWQFAKLTLRQKKDVIQHLYENGAFSEKNAADYVARTLAIGRATVFNYLREWRKS